MGTRTIDLNADLGEEVTDDDALLAVVTSANVACGFHAGTDATMRRVCEEAARRGVAVGAQVSYADRANFGRRPLDVSAELLRSHVAEQVGVLAGHAAAAGTRVAYVKPHGALYNRVVLDEEQAVAVLDGSGALPVLGLPGGIFVRLAEAAGRQAFLEAFPDRGYTDEGHLVPRDRPGALVSDSAQIARNAVALVAATDVYVHSVCVHGDAPGAVAHAIAVRRALEAAGNELAPFSSVG